MTSSVTSRNVISSIKHNEQKLKRTIIVLFFIYASCLDEKSYSSHRNLPVCKFANSKSEKTRVFSSIVRKYWTINTLLFCHRIMRPNSLAVVPYWERDNWYFNFFFSVFLSEAFNSNRTKPATIMLSALNTWTRINRLTNRNTGVVRHRWPST